MSIRKNGSIWEDREIDLFVSLWECGMPTDRMATMFDLKDAKSVSGTASKFRSYGYM